MAKADLMDRYGDWDRREISNVLAMDMDDKDQPVPRF